MLASTSDLLRLVAVPALAWAAYRDVRTRRVPNDLWTPLAALAVGLLAWDAWVAWGDPAVRSWFLVRVAVSVLLVIPLVYVFWLAGGFGGADAKAFMVLAVLFPTYPAYEVAGVVLPYTATALGVFSLTVLTNTVLVGALYPVALTVRNALDGRFRRTMFVGRPVAWEAIPRTPGRLLESPAGGARGGLDLDALRMYLRWRGASLADLRANPGLRDPATLPADTNDPTDGAVRPAGGESDHSATDGETAAGAATQRSDGGAPDEGARRDAADADEADYDDPWGAAAFLDDIESDAYGTTPEKLRAGLDVLTERDAVWVSPGIPFIVPLFVGLLVGLVYGDLLFAALRAVGMAP